MRALSAMRSSPVAPAIAALVCSLLLSVRPAPARELELDPLEDGLLLAIGLPWTGLSEYLVRTSSRDVLGTPDRDEINGLDRLAVRDYSRGWNTAGDFLMYGTVSAAASYAFALDFADVVTAGVIYLETLAIANAAKNTVKLLIARYRPYVYSGGAPGVDSREDDQSFFSGDSTMAFAAATAGVRMFAAFFPQSPWLVPLAAGAYGLATATAASRVVAGMHFITDVAAGAALGAAIGFAVPALHRNDRGSRERGLSVATAPAGLLLAYTY